MTSKELFLAAIEHREPDRVPMKIPLLYEWQQTEESYREYREYLASHGDRCPAWYPPKTRWFLDPGMIQEEVIEEADGGQRHVVHTPQGRMEAYSPAEGSGKRPKRFMSSAEDAKKFLSLPEQIARPDLSSFFEKQAVFGDEEFIWIRLPDPICVVAGNFDEEPFALLSVTDEPLIVEMLDRVCARMMEFLEYLLSHGVKGIYNFSGPEFAIPPLLSPQHFDKFVVKYNSRLYDIIHRHGSWIETHCHGKTDAFLEAFADMGSDLLNPLEPPPFGDVILSEAKRRVGDRLCLVGNVQLDDVVRGTPDHVRRLTEEAIRQAAPGGGFVFSLCAALYQPQLSQHCTDNLKLILDIVNDLGRYPIRS